jgi:hypothetical protein
MKGPLSADRLRVLLIALGVLGGAAVLTACEENPFEEGGESIDDAVDEIDDEI